MAQLPEITAAVLDQWMASAIADEKAGRSWSTNPLAIMAVIAELRVYRALDTARKTGK